LLVIITLGLAATAGWGAVRTAWVIPQTVNVRKSPSTSSPVVTQVSRGTKFFVIKFADGWAGGKTASGQWGWIREDLLQFSAAKGRALAAESGDGSASSPSGANPPVWVSVDNANVRSGPGLGYSRYGSLAKGTKLYVLERRGDWLRCKTPGGTGWLSQSVVTSDPSVGRAAGGNGGATKAFVDGEVVNLRQGPSVTADLVARVRQGQTVWVLEKRANWARVKVNNGATGWIHRDYLKPPASTSVPAGPADFPSAGASRFRTLTAWIDEDTCNIREGPGTSYPVKFQLRKGEKVTVTELEGQWCKIKTGEGQVGWVAGWVVDFSPPGQEFVKTVNGEEQEVKIGWVARPVVNLRSGPGENYPRIGELTLSTQLLIVGMKGDWFKVAMDNREIGWVGSWLIDTRGDRLARASSASGGPSLEQMPAADSSTGSETGRQIVHTAMRYLGHPYVRGGESPGGFDCSGLVQYVLGRHGISAARTAPGLFRQGRPVSREELEPGDVVFFRDTYRPGISHVGFYIGEGRFIHAANPGSGVKITDLDSSYYASRYVGARRMH
jgi:cell wall-associated NlpC family hydrolase